MRDFRELLIVAAVGGTLLFTGAAAMRTATQKQTFCTNNLKKLYQYSMMYEKDYDGLPAVELPLKPLWKFWSNCIAPYSKDKLDFACPADPRAVYMFEESSPLYSPAKLGSSCYGMNWFLRHSCAVAKKHPKAKVRYLSRPARTVFQGDSKGPYMLPPRFWQYEKDFRHADATANFSFADGHVKSMRQTGFGHFNSKKEFVTDFTMWHWL